ncbi:methyltransferase domain-containing protein [Salinimonas marina]|uniref:Methyltransferase domain-containing protein n=1 Tax=Salinimonas marina TaxID=2785918 RepID=A0A7S9DVL2_9ALTE|nr:methyltransferase domain-containing protein [Salinimonas marina]QPG04751.1 methyltransferase domain-containing protein [Salinimonas marina]
MTSATATVARQFSRAASGYDAHAAIQQRIAGQGMALLPLCPGTLLDIGCGTGANTAALAAKGYTTTGLDLAPGMVSYAAREYPHIVFCEGDAQALPFASNHFLYAFSSMALQWCERPLTAMSELARVLQPGGQASITIMVNNSFTGLDAARQAVGLAPATNPLASHSHWQTAIDAAGLLTHTARTTRYTDTFSDILSLLRSIKAVGAGTRLGPGKDKHLSRSSLTALSKAYARDTSNLLPLTYQVSHFLLEK